MVTKLLYWISITFLHPEAKSSDMMQEELQYVLSEWRQQRHLDILRTPEVFIDQQSTPDEVQHWLKAKGFSGNIQKKFVSTNGDGLFALKKDQLIQVCGRDEGARLLSQITIQRNVSGVRNTSFFVFCRLSSAILYTLAEFGPS